MTYADCPLCEPDNEYVVLEWHGAEPDVGIMSGYPEIIEIKCGHDLTEQQEDDILRKAEPPSWDDWGLGWDE
jgi:hypothetical protein